ncbi:MAG: BON domain-containing protein [Halanaerobiales bacterium]
MPRSDDVIKQSVESQLEWDTRVDASNISIRVDNGVVTLTGTVPTYRASRAAEDTAWIVMGVTSVINNLLVEYSSDITVPGDDEIKINVETILSANPDINILDMDISVTGGIVTLEGSVDSYWKILHAEELISNLPGVLGIKNNLAVVPSRDIVDETIARDVVDALERNAYVNEDNVTVKVDDGVVTLSGTVSSSYALNEADITVSYTPGVKIINNNLRIR